MKRILISLPLQIGVAAFLLLRPAITQAQFEPAGPVSAFSIPLGSLLQPQQLNRMLQKPSKEPPLILQVGSHLLFAEAHIPGSEYVGPGSRPAGLDMLRMRVSSLPKNQPIILYCGCCPWNHCPNVGPAYRLLHNMGFTNVKVLYLPSNFGDDWVSKGYSVAKGS